jgi:phage head maturation protease
VPWHIAKRGNEWCVIKDDDGESEGCHDSEEKAKAQMRALYASENRAEGGNRLPVEMRSAIVGDVDSEKRLIDVIAVPYEQEAVVEYKGELWRESFDRGSFTGIETRNRLNPVKAYRDHGPNGKSGLVGKAIALHPDRDEGLGASVKIAETTLGNDVMQLARMGVLGVSVGFAVRNSFQDQVLDKITLRRRIKRAFLDHIAFPDEGAYAGAQITAVRKRAEMQPPQIETPRIDEVVAWMESRRRHG